MSVKTILLTGSSGTVGTVVAQDLTKQGFYVIPLDIRHSYWDSRIERRTVFHDLRKPLANLKLPRKPDLIIHLAANARVHDLVLNPNLAHDNYLMTFNLLEYARTKNIDRFIFSSSREVYGESKAGERRKEEETHVSHIKSPYTASKFGSEALIHAYHECYGIRPVIVRLSNVYGRHDVSERVIPLFIYYAVRDRDICVFGHEKKLDFTYIDDCSNGFLRIVKRFDRVAGQTFNLSCGKAEKLIDLARMIVDYVGSKSQISFGDKRVGEISSYTGNISLAKQLLGYVPKVSLKNGLPLNIEWYLKAMKTRRVYESQRRNLARRGWA
ncbi:MAG: nucleoside-diphosphate sugar epimerase [Candidatus Zixiibacteriota bacterium]|nr:MAG: nucleoside-diphosphate sugar epimerase [candidate division Zixibacteria bacterium]